MLELYSCGQIRHSAKTQKDRDISRPYIIFGIGAQEPKNEDRCIQFRSHGYCWTSLHELKDREKDWHLKLFPNQ